MVLKVSLPNIGALCQSTVGQRNLLIGVGVMSHVQDSFNSRLCEAITKSASAELLTVVEKQRGILDKTPYEVRYLAPEDLSPRPSGECKVQILGGAVILW